MARTGSKMGRRLHAAFVVCKAIREPGRNPEYHRAIMEKHRDEWPTLWKALDRLLKEMEM